MCVCVYVCMCWGEQKNTSGWTGATNTMPGTLFIYIYPLGGVVVFCLFVFCFVLFFLLIPSFFFFFFFLIIRRSLPSSLTC